MERRCKSELGSAGPVEGTAGEAGQVEASRGAAQHVEAGKKTGGGEGSRPVQKRKVPMAKRQNFDRKTRLAIIKRASVNGVPTQGEL